MRDASGVRAVLFDFGNTLFAHAPLAATIRGACQGLGAATSTSWAAALADRIDALAQTDAERRHPRDLDAGVWRERWHVLYAVADDQVAGLGGAVYAAMHDPSQWHPYAGTLATLAELAAAAVPVAVVSNTGWDVRKVFAHHGVLDTVQHFALSYEVGSVKPSPTIFHSACAALGVVPGEALMVGDDPVADAGAVRAGLRTLLLPALPPQTDNGIQAVLQFLEV